MITLAKKLAYSAMQQAKHIDAINIADIVAFCDDNKCLEVNDESLFCVFSDNSCLLVIEDEGLNYKTDFNDSFIDFILEVNAAYKNNDLCENLDTLEELFSVFEDFSSNQSKLFDIVLCDYSYSYDIETLVNYVAENASIFEGSRSDCAYELIEDCYDTKSMGNLANYIDYDAFGRDIELEGSIQEIGYNVYWTNAGDIY